MRPFPLTEEIPGPSEYRALRAAVCVRDGNKLIGMGGRVIGDGGCDFEVVDIAVQPDIQRQGIGCRIIESLMCYLRQTAPESAYVGLIADGGASDFYR